MSLHARVGHGGSPTAPDLRLRYHELEAKVKDWPRTAENDPFYAGSLELAEELQKASGLQVILGFNEFCAPSLDEAFAEAASQAAEKVIVLTPMMTRGGEHSAVEIPEAIRRAQTKYPGKIFVYAWPFPTEDVAAFLASQAKKLF